jgi:hypothetical protein
MAGKDLYSEWRSFMGLDPSANEFAVEPQDNEEGAGKKDLSVEDIAATRQVREPWPEEAGPELATSFPVIANEDPSIGEGDKVILTADTFEETLMKELAIFVSWASQRGGSAPQASTSGKKIVILAKYFYGYKIIQLNNIIDRNLLSLGSHLSPTDHQVSVCHYRYFIKTEP